MSDFAVQPIGDCTRRNAKCCGAVYGDTREKVDSTPGVQDDSAIATQNRILPILRNLGAVLPSVGDPYYRRIANAPGHA